MHMNCTQSKSTQGKNANKNIRCFKIIIHAGGNNRVGMRDRHFSSIHSHSHKKRVTVSPRPLCCAVALASFSLAVGWLLAFRSTQSVSSTSFACLVTTNPSKRKRADNIISSVVGLKPTASICLVLFPGCFLFCVLCVSNSEGRKDSICVHLGINDDGLFDTIFTTGDHLQGVSFRESAFLNHQAKIVCYWNRSEEANICSLSCHRRWLSQPIPCPKRYQMLRLQTLQPNRHGFPFMMLMRLNFKSLPQRTRRVEAKP